MKHTQLKHSAFRNKHAGSISFFKIAIVFCFAITVNFAKAQAVLRVNYAAPPTSTEDGSSWDNAYHSLQDAIEDAVAGTEIWIAQGVYRPSAYPFNASFPVGGASTRDYAFSLVSNVSMYGGFKGTETLKNQRDFVNNTTTLSGNIGVLSTNADNCYHVIVGVYASNVVIDGLNIQDGNGDDVTGHLISFPPPPFQSTGYAISANKGAGMHLVGCNVYYKNGNIQNNNATTEGGGIFQFAWGTSNFSNCFIASNTTLNASTGYGGSGIAAAGFPATPINNIFSNTVFWGNQTNGNGGAYWGKFASASFINGSIINNIAGIGGGIFAGDSCKTTLTNSILSENSGSFFAHTNHSNSGITWTSNEPTVIYSCLQGGGSGIGNIVSDPMFVNSLNPYGGDFKAFTDDDGLKLSATSPAVNAGTITTATTDILGVLRPQGSAFDMGAYERIFCTPTALPAISGASLMCSLAGTAVFRIAFAGGTWSSSNTAVVTVNSAGIVTANANGVADIIYTYTNASGCVSSVSRSVRVAYVSLPIITGPSSTCVGSTITLSNATAGGVWSSLNTRATVDASGVVTGRSLGTAEIRYTVTNTYGCSLSLSKYVGVNSLPATPNISYAPGTSIPFIRSGSNFCRNRLFTLVGSPSGGVWTALGVATVSAGGEVSTGSTLGYGSVRYTYTSPTTGCSSYREIGGNVVACSPRGMNGQQSIVNSQWSLYPNPSTGVFNIKVDRFKAGDKIVITDILGKVVIEQNINSQLITLNSQLSKGMYLVSVINEGGKETKKVMIE